MGDDERRSGERRAFVDGYLRRGLAGAEMKSFVGTTGAEGGYAVPRELDAMVDATLKSISPIRQGATFVMNSATLARIRKFKTSDGAFLWAPGLCFQRRRLHRRQAYAG